MPGTVTKRQLSEPRQKFLQLMQKFNFCHIKSLHLRAGEPVFEPPPVVVQDMKLGGDNDPRVQMYLKDFALKSQHVELFQMMDEMQNGVIDEIEVRYGLPFRLFVTRPV